MNRNMSGKPVSIRLRAANKGLAATVIWLLAALCAWIATGVFSLPRQAERTFADVISSYFFTPTEVREDIVILGITEETLARLPYRSPISRAYLAEVLEPLLRAEPRAIGLDVIFDQPTIPAIDDRLRELLAGADTPIVIATGDAKGGLTDRQLSFQDEYLAGLTTGLSALTTTGGTVRHAYLGDEDEPSFSLALFAAAGGDAEKYRGRDVVPLHYPSLTKEAVLPLRNYPLHLVDKLPAAWLRGRIVLVGGMLPLQDRHRTPYSVRGGQLSDTAGVAIHALSLAQLLDGPRTQEPAAMLSLLALLLMTAGGVPLGTTSLPASLRLLGLAALVFGYWGLTAWVQLSNRLPLAPLTPVLGLVICTTLSSFYFGRSERRNRRLIERAFGRYVSPQVVAGLQQSGSMPVLGGEERAMSFVFTDLASFTTLSESITPSDLVDILQRYLGGLVDIAFSHGATIDKFVGDAVHLFFGAPMDQPDHAQRALRCAVEMDEFSVAFQKRQAELGMAFGVTRIGVHTGKAVVGNVGGERLFSYTAHGDVVNTTARLEVANKHLGTRICVSEAVVRENPMWPARPIGDLALRGKSKTLKAYTSLEAVDEELAQAYMQAYELLSLSCSEEGGPVESRQHSESASRAKKRALAAFASLAERYPDDTLVALHLHRLERGEGGTLIVQGGA